MRANTNGRHTARCWWRPAVVGILGPLVWLQAENAVLFLSIFFAYFLYGIGFPILMLLLSVIGLRDVRRRVRAAGGVRHPVTVAIPAHNEEAVIVDCIRSLCRQSLVPAEIIVVDDGSRDGTLARLDEAFDLGAEGVPGGFGHGVRAVYRSRTAPAILVVATFNGGKANALNVALSLAGGELFITADADCAFDRDAIFNMARLFAAEPDLIAAGGVVAAANGVAQNRLRLSDSTLPAGLLSKLQWIEYAGSFIWRFGWTKVNNLLLLSGSFSGFRTALLRQVGGFDSGSLTEDYEIAFRLHEHCRARGRPYRIMTVPDALVYTLVPETVASFYRQRVRWFQGFLETMIKYRGVALRPRYGALGLFTAPVKMVDGLLPFWAVLTYLALFENIAAGSQSVATGLLLNVVGLRIGVGVVMSWILLAISRRYVAPRLNFGDHLLLLALAPLNEAFQRLSWLVYGINAHIRVLGNVRRWEKSVRGAFRARAS